MRKWVMSHSYMWHDSRRVTLTPHMRMCHVTHATSCHILECGLTRHLWSCLHDCSHMWSYTWHTYMSHVYDRHVPWLSHGTRIWVTYMRMRLDSWRMLVPPRLNSHIVTCHTYEWVMSHIWMSHVTYMNESCQIYEWVMSHICMTDMYD